MLRYFPDAGSLNAQLGPQTLPCGSFQAQPMVSSPRVMARIEMPHGKELRPLFRRYSEDRSIDPIRTAVSTRGRAVQVTAGVQY